MTPQDLEQYIHIVDDFPKAGVKFKDFSPMLKEKLPETITLLSEGIDWDDVDVVLGIESRGFILGSAMALMNKKGFIPVRKKGKLPPPLISESYELEYGSDTLEMAQNNEKLRAVIVDDVLATGGTLGATLKLARNNNFEVTAISVLIDLKFLNSFDPGDAKLVSVLSYD